VFTIADAFAKTHLVESFANSLQDLSILAPCWIFLVVALIVTAATNLTSNTAVVSIGLPVFYQLAVHLPFDTHAILMIVAIAGSFAFMLPIGTPPNAIVMAGGFLKTSQMIRGGFMVTVVGIFFLVLTAYFFWM
jgi:solute carrier family 13 (sodium-dependent dicarboxylate transporter), member 2/3/5